MMATGIAVASNTIGVAAGIELPTTRKASRRLRGMAGQFFGRLLCA